MAVDARELLEHLKREIDRLTADIYDDADEAFCHFALQALYGLDDDDAAEACSFSTSAPGHPGAFWQDEEAGRVVLATFRYHPSANARLGRRPVSDLIDAWSSLNGTWAARMSPALGQIAEAITQARARNPELLIELLCVALGTVTQPATRSGDEFNAARVSERVHLRLVDISELADADFERRSREAGPLDRPITLSLRSFFEELPVENGAPTLVASIDGLQLAQIEQEYRFRIFQRNVRYQLPGKINENIDKTLKEPEGRHNFWYYNNGISIVCDSYQLDPIRKSVEVENLQIVNGCQTTTTLGANIDLLTSPAPTVLVRIIASSDDELQRDITLYNNRQNAVRDRDLLSNDKIQESLQAGFEALEPPWFYERKRGAWKAEVVPNARARARFGSRQINNEKAAQAAYAFHVDPGEARARKRLLFVRAREDPKGFYDTLFRPSTTPEWLLVPYIVNEFVAARKREYVRRVRSIDDDAPIELSIADKKQLQLAWIKFADQALLGTIALYWSRRKPLSQRSLEEMLKDEALQQALPAAYALAIRDLGQFFLQRETEASEREQTFVAANYLKGNWAEISKWLELQEDYRESAEEDPFGQIVWLARPS